MALAAMWSSILLLFLVGLAAATNNAWKSDTQYVYRVSGRTLTGLSDISSEYSGVLVKATLTLQAKSDGSSLIGQITDGQYAKIFKKLPAGWDSHIPSADANFQPMPWSGKPFEIKIFHGVIKDLIVDSDISEWEANMLKSIVSQIQLDTEGRNLIKSNMNQLPEEGRNSAVYKTMEETITGEYETLYEINPLPEYVVQMEPYLVPFQTLKGEDLIEVVKTKNFSNAERHSGYFYGLGEMENSDPSSNKLGDLMLRSSLSRVILSGNLHRYTIQHSVTTNKIYIAPSLINNNQKGLVVSQLNISLASMQERTDQSEGPSNPKSLNGLIYVYEGRQHLKLPSHLNEQDASYNYYQSDEQSLSSHESRRRSSSEEHNEQNEDYDENVKPNLDEVPFSPLLPYFKDFKGRAMKAAQLANEIGEELQNPELIPEKQTLTKYVILTSLIRTLEEQEIEQVAQSLYSKEDRSAKGDAWKAFRDAVIECGTGPAFLTIQKWISTGKLQNEEAAEALSAMAQAVRQPTDDYIRAFYKFVTKPEVKQHKMLNVSALLSLSQLVGEVYVNRHYSRNQYPVDIFGVFDTKVGRRFVLSEYIPYLTAELRRAVADADSHKIQVYIRALGLIGHPAILTAYEPYLEGIEQMSQFQRVHIVHNLEKLVKYYPRYVRTVLYKIYQNPRENPDVRIAAIYQLIKTAPSPTMLQRIAEFTNVDNNEQVNAAVMSVIKHLAHLNTTAYEYAIESAKAAEKFLSNRLYGPRYSQFHKEHYGKQETVQSDYIASPDSYLPKDFRFFYRYNYGGYSKQYLNFQSAVSSVSEMSNVLMRQFEEYLDQMEQQKKSALDSMKQWSSEGIVKTLNIKVDEREQVEGNLMFKLGGYDRFFTIDNHTIEALPKMLKEAEEALRDGKPFRLTRFNSRYEIEMSYPTEMALPFTFYYNVPTVLSLDGMVKLIAQPELSNGEKLRMPDTVRAEGDLRMLLSLKIQGRLGFLTPYDRQQYVSGYEKNTQLYLPIKHNINVDLNKKEIQAQLAFKNPEQNTKLVYYKSTPYVTHCDILQLQPAISNADTQVVGPTPKNYYDLVYGQESIGLAFRFKYEGDQKYLDSRWLHDQIRHAKNYASFPALWFSQKVAMGKMSIEYVAEQSQNKEMKAVFLYYNNTYETPQTQNVDIQQVYQPPKEAMERLEDFGRKASAGVINANVMGLHANINFEGGRPIEYDGTVVCSTSKVDVTSRALLYWGKASESGAFKIAASLKNDFPILNELDAEKILQSDISSTIQAKVVFGRDFQSATHIDGQVKMRRSDERTQYLRDSWEYQQCQMEMREGNKQLHECEKVTQNAKHLDSILTQWQYKNLDPRMYNFTAQTYSWFRYFNFYNSHENYVDGGNRQQGRVNVDVEFFPDYSAVNVSLNTEKYEAHYENIKLEMEHLYEEYPLTYWTLSHFPKLKSYRPTCVVDKKGVKSYDNRTYEARLSDLWTVMMVHVPLHARSSKYSSQELKNYMEYQNNYAILVKESASDKKEVKIYLRTPRTNSDVSEIDLKPNNAQYPTILVNNQPQSYSEKKVAKLYDDYIQVYALPHGEVKIDIEDEFSVIYDGSRVMVRLYNDRYYNEVRGICGNANAMAADDLRAPENCALRTPQELVEAYTISEGASPRDPKHNEYKSGCYPYSYVYANVISLHDELENRESNYRGRSSKPLRSCSKQQTRYLVEGDEVCFTIRPLPQCQSPCSPTQTILKSVPVHCVKMTGVTQFWMKQIDKGGNPDFALKKVTKNMNFDVPQSCRQS